MKVTAIIDDKIIDEALKYSGATTITAALKIALKEYIALQKIKDLGQEVKKEPLKFIHTAEELRSQNRR